MLLTLTINHSFRYAASFGWEKRSLHTLFKEIAMYWHCHAHSITVSKL